ncbi:SIS domain-containing protein [Plantactinospora sp. S1510]|uniref:SIS domain-containing protein n=1 Tax=Plantactinospora alkalitolerans TaxID=2789879 RepID=A0ABS0GS74_9ACTN|nr:SIS domain-containing protein [Plantactinospora alkalitolerans]MBF9129050.1 SIS domain-containing protein [Plantactinospora alkalitolerans]
MTGSTDVLDSHLAGLASALLPYRTEAGRLDRWGDELARLLAGGGRLLVAGNGGSAAEAQHLAAELVGKLCDDRAPLSAIALCAETSSLTAIGNDYGFDEVFARQVRAHGRSGDILLLLSTSGRSANLVRAARAGRELGMRCWAFTGPTPNPLADACTEVLAVPSQDSQVVQELHLVSAHVLCAYVDAYLPVLFGPAGGYGTGQRLPAATPYADSAPARPGSAPAHSTTGQVRPSGVEDELVLRVPGTLDLHRGEEGP